MTFVLMMTMFLLAPWVVLSAARYVYHEDLRATARERAHSFPVRAILLQNAESRVATSYDGMSPSLSVLAHARWIGPDGAVRTGSVPAGPGTRRGAAVLIWVDKSGILAPHVRRNAALDAIVVAVVVTVLFVVVLTGIHHSLVWWLNRRRLRSWQAEWLVVGPSWSHHR